MEDFEDSIKTRTNPGTRFDPARRTYCDRCRRCTFFSCDGSTARHHFIHVNEDDFFFPNKSYGSKAERDAALRKWLLQHTGFPEYPDRNSRV